jgi:hypothetical protein
VNARYGNFGSIIRLLFVISGKLLDLLVYKGEGKCDDKSNWWHD